MTYASLKQQITPALLVSFNKLQILTGLTKRDLLIHLQLLPKKPTIYSTKREWKRGEDTQVTDELFITASDAQTIFNITL